MQKEYGGYLPLELQHGNEYYKGENVISLNCARYAIVYAIQDAEYKKIYIPHYMCESIQQTLFRERIAYETYHIDEQFFPLNVKLQKGECILYPNYFGIFSECHIRKIVSQFKNVILDNTQAFFSKPFMEVYNVYSCRKFFGVTDGAYLIKAGIKQRELQRDESAGRASHLLISMEQGTNAAYAQSLISENQISQSPMCEMSRLTHYILDGIDYQQVVQKRQRNYDSIVAWLQKKGFLNVKRPSECVPMIYPLYCSNVNARKILLENHVYVPQWWKYLLNSAETSRFERKLSVGVLPLPIDQRYDEKDMCNMMSMIIQKLSEKGISLRKNGNSYWKL